MQPTWDEGMDSMMYAVLRRLGHETFTSGEVVAGQLGCSRATVHNALREASGAGIVVHAVQGRGYRLAEPIDWLVPDRLQAELQARGMQFHFFDSTVSTNTFLLEAARGGEPHRTVAVTEWQTGGRGRRGRSWQADLGSSLAFSYLWRSARPVAELSGLSLAVGVVLVEALQRLGLEKAKVKWPNDIVVENQKLAGVLIEMSGDVLGPSAAVIGVGINVRGGEGLTRDLGRPVTDLSRHLEGVGRNELFLDLVRAIDEGLELFEREGFGVFQDAWNACHAHHGRKVDILTGQGGRIPGVAMGVDEQGALLLQTPAGVRRFHSGEVSLRSAGA